MKQTMLIVLFIILCVLTMACISKDALRKIKFKIYYAGQHDRFLSENNKKAPTSARVGTVITLCYPFVATDTKYKFTINGNAISPDYSHEKGYIIRFVMPANDVTICCTSFNIMEIEHLSE